MSTKPDAWAIAGGDVAHAIVESTYPCKPMAVATNTTSAQWNIARVMTLTMFHSAAVSSPPYRTRNGD